MIKESYQNYLFTDKWVENRYCTGNRLQLKIVLYRLITF